MFKRQTQAFEAHSVLILTDASDNALPIVLATDTCRPVTLNSRPRGSSKHRLLNCIVATMSRQLKCTEEMSLDHGHLSTGRMRNLF